MRQTMKVLEIIKSEVAATGRFPTAAQIAIEMGWRNASSVADVLDRLAVHGHLHKKKASERWEAGKPKWVYSLK